jgi:protein-disulfide isomerase
MNDESRRQRPTRRTLLSGVAVGAVVLAGCAGGDDGNGNESDGGGDNSNESNGNQSAAGEFAGADGGVAAGAPELDGASVPVLGDPDAPVTLAVYEDFICPHCRRYNEQFLSDITTEYIEPDRIRYEHRTFPVVHERHSWEAASAAREVFEEYGNEAFWAYKSRLFDRQDEVPANVPDLYGEIADEMRLDSDAIQTAATERAHDDDIERDQSRGRERGVGATPTFVVNGDPVATQRGDTIESIVERTMDRLDSALGENGADSGGDDGGNDGSRY